MRQPAATTHPDELTSPGEAPPGSGLATRAGPRWRLAGAVAFVLVTAGLLALDGPGGVRPARADDDDRGGYDRFDDDRFDARDAGGGAREAFPDPGGGAGMPLEFERDEIVASGLRPEQVEQLRSRGFMPVQQRRLETLGLDEVRFRIPRAYSVASATQLVRDLSSTAVVDANHLYRPAAIPCEGPACKLRQLVAWTAAGEPCDLDTTVGLVDTAVATDHPMLTGARIETRVARSPDRKAAKAGHGTAVASVLVGRSPADVVGLMPSARLVAVDAFHAGSGGERMDAFDLLAALDQLLAQRVRVINLSFAGPANALVEQAVLAAEQRGTLLIAAVGNDGPKAPPQYPAAYPSVIGVTAVDQGLRVYRRAVQGGHVEIGAPGVDVPVANAGGWLSRKAVVQSGTSIAAPFVTAAAARLAAAQPRLAPAEIRRRLTAGALDLGSPGHDAVFGHGLLQAAGPCRPAATPSRP